MIKVGLIGYGYWGPNLLRNLMENHLAEVRYCCDLDKERLKKAQARYPGLAVTTDVYKLLTHSEIEAVLIATPVATHFSLAREALKHNKHVFVEKPLAASVRQAQELIKLSEKKKCILAVGHIFEYAPAVLKMKEIVSSGELGQIYFISSRRVNLGIHQKDVSVIWDLAPHDFSIIFFVLEEEPIVIQAMGRGCINKTIPDVAFINLRFPSGVIAQVELSWLAPMKIRNTTIIGSKKMLVYDDTQSVEKIKIFDHGISLKDPESFGEYQLTYRTGDIVSPRLGTYEPLARELGHFVECIKTGQRPQTDGYAGLRVVRALELAEKSLRLNGQCIQMKKH